MAATAELPRPGVEVVQEFQSAAPTIVRPTLVPFVCGPAKEIIDVLNTDGTLNANAKQGPYNQLPLLVSETAFPSPRGNIAQVVVEQDSIEAFLMYGGSLRQLKTDPGSSFLKAWNLATQASVETKQDPGGGFIVDTLTMVLAIDVPARLNTTQDVSVTFAGATPGAHLTPAQVAAQINSALGATLATVTGDNRVRITSSKFGALSSVTVRPGGSANTALGFVSASVEYRVTGSGFRAQDQGNNTTISPWVEWNRGEYLENGVVTSFPGAPGGGAPGFLLVDNSGAANFGPMSALTYTGGGSIQLAVGDVFYGDGLTPVSGAFVKKIEAARFKIGTLNTRLSIFDAEGNVVTAVYDDANLTTLFGTAPYAPNYAWFEAENLLFSAVPQPAKVTGTIEGTAATPGVVEGTGTPAGPFNLTGLTLIVGTTVNGVVQPDQTFTFTGGPLADMPAVATAIGTHLTGVAAVNDSGNLKLATSLTGANQEIVLRKTSTAGATLGFVFGGNDLVGDGTDVTFVAHGPVVTSAPNPSFTAVPTNTLVLKLSTDGGSTFPTTRTHTFGAGPFANIGAIITDIQGDGAFTANLTFTAVGTALAIQWNPGSPTDQNVLRVDSSSTAVGGANKLQFTSNQQAAGHDQMAGETFKFKLNGRPKIYTVLFGSNSVVDAVNAINLAAGWPVAAIGGTNLDELSITSDLAGIASSVEIIGDSSTTQANVSLGLVAGITYGSGRPNPDFYLDVNGAANIGADIIRNQVTGDPLDPATADLYIQYKGLRLDVSPRATGMPSLISVSDVTTLTTVLSPLTPDNPLGLGMFFALINAPGILCTGMGVADAPASAPDGTLAAYAEVAGFIESQEVYAIAPLTHDETVAQMFKAHVELMESPEQKGERILFFNPLVPARANDKLIISGLNGSSSSMVANAFTCDVSPLAALVAAGINPALPIPVSANLYLQITVGGVVRKYNVSAVSGSVLTLNTTFTGSQNTDGFFTTTPLAVSLVDEAYTLSVRGAPLLLAGSTLPDKDAIAATVQAKAQAYGYRRMFYVFPDKVTASVNGVQSLLEAYHACAAIAGMCAHFPPQQGFTNMPMVGFNGVQGSQDTFSNRQLNVMAAGGVYELVQDTAGAPIISRMQLSTDMTSIEKRELSITKIVDFTAKFLRAGLRNFIGTFNITQPFLDTVSTVIHGMLKFLEENGVLISGDLNNIIQSTDSPDTVLVDVLLDVPFPCNYIRLTLVI